MANSSLYFPDDTVSLRNDRFKIGLVIRTPGNVETHTPDPLGEYGDTLKKHAHVSTELWTRFLQSGIPPQDTIVVAWSLLPWISGGGTVLIKACDVILEDRALLLGDVVKQHPQDPSMGVIIQASTSATLLQPLPWSTSRPDTRQDSLHSYPIRPVRLLENIPSEELCPTKQYEIEDFVLYKGWVGRITDVEETALVRLGNNSVVIPEDTTDIDLLSADPDFQVGDVVTTKKSNLRRGRWIYGAYNASVAPTGFVVDVHQISIAVDWLAHHPIPVVSDEFDGIMDEPNNDLDSDDIQSGELSMYDRRELPADSTNGHATRINFDMTSGDRVRFCNLDAACDKYKGLSTGRLDKIPRTSTLGYDMNVFLVVKTRTILDILWQDGTITERVDALDLVPYFDIDEELEPGSLISTKMQEINEWTKVSDHVGVVQAVSSQDQMGKIRWMDDASVEITNDDDQEILATSKTGVLAEKMEHVSLYDIDGSMSLTRRLGDFVKIQPSAHLFDMMAKTGPHPQSARFADTCWACDVDRAGRYAWFGEVIRLGLDGLITVRVAAANVVRDLKIPWECTLLLWRGDEEGLSSVDSEYEDDMTGSDMSISDLSGSDDMARTGDDAESLNSWETEDESLGDMDEIDIDNEKESDDLDASKDTLPDHNASHIDTDGDMDMSEDETQTASAPSTTRTRPIDHDPDSIFSYTKMFEQTATLERPPAFEVLEGYPPEDHK